MEYIEASVVLHALEDTQMYPICLFSWFSSYALSTSGSNLAQTWWQLSFTRRVAYATMVKRWSSCFYGLDCPPVVVIVVERIVQTVLLLYTCFCPRALVTFGPWTGTLSVKATTGGENASFQTYFWPPVGHQQPPPWVQFCYLKRIIEKDLLLIVVA